MITSDDGNPYSIICMIITIMDIGLISIICECLIAIIQVSFIELVEIEHMIYIGV